MGPHWMIWVNLLSFSLLLPIVGLCAFYSPNADLLWTSYNLASLT